MKYKTLEHPADLKMRFFGKTREELFLNGLLGMMENLKPEIQGLKTSIKRKITIKSIDLSTLLVDFLSEALYQAQVNKETYNNIKFDKITNTEIEGNFIGKKITGFNEDIKAVTYYNLDVHQKRDRTWEATIIFDV